MTIMGNRFTLNINCRAMPEEGYARFLRGSSSWVYLMDPESRHIDDALNLGKRVVVRTYAHDERTFHLRHTPQQVLNMMHERFSAYRGKEVYFIIGVNEPEKPGDDYFPRLSDWLITWGRLAIAAGYGVVLGGFNTSKSIREKDGVAIDVVDGVWDDLLYFADKNTRCIIDFHDYTTGRAWAQQHDRLDTIAARLWKPRPLRWDDERNIHDQWHIGRHAPLVARARRLGLRVRFGVGECYHDHMDDLGVIREQLNSRYGMSEYMNDVRGTRSHYRYYAALSGLACFGWDDLAQMVLEDITWLDEQYPQEFEYFAIFAYNRNKHWVAYDWSIAEMAPALEHVLNYQAEAEQMQNGEAVVIHVEAAALNVRTAANRSAQVVRTLAKGTRLDTQAVRGFTESDGFAWLNFEMDGQSVWAAAYALNAPNVPYLRIEWKATDPEPEIPEAPLDHVFVKLPEMAVPVNELERMARYFQAQADNPYALEHPRYWFALVANTLRQKTGLDETKAA